MGEGLSPFRFRSDSSFPSFPFSPETDDVAKSCPVSYRTINQYGGTTCVVATNFSSSWTHFKSCSPYAGKFSHVNCTRKLCETAGRHCQASIGVCLTNRTPKTVQTTGNTRVGTQPRPRRLVIECAFMKLKGRKLEEFSPTSPGH